MIRENQRLLNRLNVLSDGVLIYLMFPLAYWLRFHVMPNGVVTVQLTNYYPHSVVYICRTWIISIISKNADTRRSDQITARRSVGYADFAWLAICRAPDRLLPLGTCFVFFFECWYAYTQTDYSS